MPWRRQLVPSLLCFGMVVIPLVALRGGGSGGPARVSVSLRPAGEAASDGPLDSSGQPTVVDVSGLAALKGTPDPSSGPAEGADAVVAAVVSPVRAALPTPVVSRTSRSAPSKSIAVAQKATPKPVRAASPPPAARAPGHSETGDASWYGAPSGTCAHKTLPFGTVLTVTNLANGLTATCRVADRGPFWGGRIVDLSESTFSQLAPSGSGVITVRITW